MLSLTTIRRIPKGCMNFVEMKLLATSEVYIMQGQRWAIQLCAPHRPKDVCALYSSWERAGRSISKKSNRIVIILVKSVWYASRFFIRWQRLHVFTHRKTFWPKVHQYISIIIRLVVFRFQCPMQSYINFITPSRWPLEPPLRPFVLLFEKTSLAKPRTSTLGVAPCSSRWHRRILFVRSAETGRPVRAAPDTRH